MKYNPDIVRAYFRECGLPECETEYRFCERMWRFDFAFKGDDYAVALEVEGLNGRHQRTAGFINDMRKYNRAATMGWLVLRTTNREVCMKETVDNIKLAIYASRNMRKGDK